MRGLTDRQKQILKFIVEFTRQNGYPPTIREIGAAFGLTSTSTVQLHINALIRKGYITRRAQSPRAITVMPGLTDDALREEVEV
jgi:repressor LexA